MSTSRPRSCSHSPPSRSSIRARTGPPRCGSWGQGPGSLRKRLRPGWPRYRDRWCSSTAPRCFRTTAGSSRSAAKRLPTSRSMSPSPQPTSTHRGFGRRHASTSSASSRTSPVLERAACVVCHAGMGVTQKALAHGVPVVAIPFGRDQPEVARRVEIAHAGVRLPVRKLSPDRLIQLVHRAIALRPGAKRIARAFAEIDTPTVAAAALEELAAARSPLGNSQPAA